MEKSLFSTRECGLYLSGYSLQIRKLLIDFISIMNVKLRNFKC